MGKIGVHLKDEFELPFQGPVKPCNVRPAQPLLFSPVQDVCAFILRADPVGDLPCSVGRTVIDDQDFTPGRRLENRRGNGFDIFPLVVGRNDDQYVPHVQKPLKKRSR